MIRLVEENDIDSLLQIYKDLYDDADIGEYWSLESIHNLMMFFYNIQRDLFFVAEDSGHIVGAVMSIVKPWFDGNWLCETEIFVSKESQNKGLAKKLYFEHLKSAKDKYNVKTIEFHTYGEESEFPQNWYKRIGFKKSNELIIMDANIDDILNKLQDSNLLDK